MNKITATGMPTPNPICKAFWDTGFWQDPLSDDPQVFVAELEELEEDVVALFSLVVGVGTSIFWTRSKRVFATSRKFVLAPGEEPGCSF